MKGNFSSWLYLLIFAYMLHACQDSYEHVTTSTQNPPIAASSALAQLVSFSTLNDGSFDNILDNASSISIKLPVTVIANDQELNIASIEDFEKIIEIYDQEPFVKDSIELIYPVTAILADYSEITLNTPSELEILVAQSIEGGDDADIECLDYSYPIRVSKYDTLNQIADVISIGSDKELFQLFDQPGENNLTSFIYPLHLVSNTNEEIIVENNLDLESRLNQGNVQCDEGDEPYYKEGDFEFKTAFLSIQLTDAPFPFDLVAETNIKIDQISAKKVSDTGEDQLIILTEEEFEFNLLELTNGLTANLVDIEIPVGAYDQIRLRVTESDVKLTDERVFDLKIPSGQQSGIKVNLSTPINIEAESENSILLDFDVSRSFVVQGNPDTPAGIKGFIFKPVIKASNLSETGTLSGEVTDASSSFALEGVQISVYAADTLNTTTFSDENGEYTVLGLTPGEYELQAEYDGYLASDLIITTIMKGELSSADFSLTPE